MLINHVALTVETDKLVKFSELAKVGAALQKQVMRDFVPHWNVQATVSAFARIEDVPLGYWPVIVAENVKDAAGYHEDKDGQPFALVEAGDSWSLTASHETLEMLADPFGKRLVVGVSPKKNQGRVEFLVEVCDPSEAEDYAYTVNGILVSDFYTPRYFDPASGPGIQYSHSGSIVTPRQVLPGGYLSWHDPKDDHWWQLTYFRSKPVIRDIGKFDARLGNYRAFTDYHTPNTQQLSHLAKKSTSMQYAKVAMEAGEESTSSKAVQWRSQIRALRSQTRPKVAAKQK